MNSSLAVFSQLKQYEGESYEQFAARVGELACQAEPHMEKVPLRTCR